MKGFGIKIAVITNSSLLWDEDVLNDLIQADLISVKIDTVFTKIWLKLNRPHGKLHLQEIKSGIINLSRNFQGTLLTETMLVKGVNDSIESLYKTAEFINSIQPSKAFLLFPTRPPAEESVVQPDLRIKNTASEIFRSLINNISVVDYDEGKDFGFTSAAEQELLSIVSVHPMKKDAVKEFLNKSNSDWELVQALLDRDVLKTKKYSGDTFFIKNN